MGASFKMAYYQISALKKILQGLNTVSEYRRSEGRNYRRSLERLRERGYIFLGREKIKLTQKGRQALNFVEHQEVSIPTSVAWDGHWHLISYDIPEELKNERRFFRLKLKQLGFTKLQASLWLYPYPCREEIAIFANDLRVSPFIIYLTTERVPNNAKLVAKYNLKG